MTYITAFVLQTRALALCGCDAAGMRDLTIQAKPLKVVDADNAPNPPGRSIPLEIRLSGEIIHSCKGLSEELFIFSAKH